MSYQPHENVLETAQGLYGNWVTAKGADKEARALYFDRLDKPKLYNAIASYALLTLLLPPALLAPPLRLPVLGLIMEARAGLNVGSRRAKAASRFSEAWHEAVSHFEQNQEVYTKDAIEDAREAGIEIDFGGDVANTVELAEVCERRRENIRQSDIDKYEHGVRVYGERHRAIYVRWAIEDAEAAGVDINWTGENAYDVRVIA